jgi:hypothetical protein
MRIVTSILRLISAFAGLQNGIGFGIRAALGEELGTALSDLAADFGCNAVHG